VAYRVADMGAGLEKAGTCLSDARQQSEAARQAAQAWALAHQGAVQRAADAVIACLPVSPKSETQ